MSELNLIPYELKAKRNKTIKLKNYISIAIIILAILFVILYIPNLYLDKLNSEENSLTVKISSNSKVFAENTKLLGEIESYNSYIKQVDTLKKQRVSVSDKVKNLQKYISASLVLTKIDYSNGILALEGTTTDYSSVSIFVANLQMTKEYPLSRIVKINGDDSQSTNNTSVVLGKYKFTINITE